MLDIKYIRENADEIKKTIQQKNIKLDLEQLLEIADKRGEIQQKLDELRAERKKIASTNGKKPSPDQIAKGKEIKQQIAELEKEFNTVDEQFEELMVKVPTIQSPDTPIGKDDSENIEIFKWGEPTQFDFKPKDHIQLGKELDLIDLERGVKVAGYRGYYLKNEAAVMQLALMMYALEKLINKGFTPIIPPTLVREFSLFGSGYFAGKRYNPDVDEIYKIANEEIEADGTKNKEDKFLIGTAEPALLAYYANEILDQKQLPVKFCGFSQCYRSEIGSYGKDTKGMYRVHEFMKIEQVCICEADLEKSDKYHQEMIAISKELHEDLGLPYRQLAICTGDLSPGKYKMFDLEAWIPSRNEYGETGSASNFLDWQSRRLNVRYRTGKNEVKYVYMLNNTAIASVRTIIAILENFQQADGTVVIPEVLRKYFQGKTKIEPKK